LKRHADGKLTKQGLPALPVVETVQAGTLRPRPRARLSWTFDDSTYEPPLMPPARGRRDRVLRPALISSL
jgi:hypothetical protein